LPDNGYRQRMRFIENVGLQKPVSQVRILPGARNDVRRCKPVQLSCNLGSDVGGWPQWRIRYSYRNTERNSGAEQHFRDHQMPNRWSRCMLRFQCSLRRASRSSCHLSHRSMNLSSILSTAITMLGVVKSCR
jgi:hypothetical protein